MHPVARIGLQAGILALKGVYAVLKLLPTKPKVTFMSRQSNEPSLDIKLVEAELERSHPEYELVKLPKRLDNPLSYLPHLFVQMYHAATSRVLLLDSYCITASLLTHKRSLKVVQMWHAVGCMKKFGYAMLGQAEGSDPDVARIMRMHRGYDHILISSKSFIRDYEEGFGCDPSQVVEIPQPRVDALLDEDRMARAHDRLLEAYPQLRGKKTIVYCPTFRKDEQGAAAALERLAAEIDFEAYNLLYKPHPLSKVVIDEVRVLFVREEAADLFSIADYVISDYSSIIYEAGLAGCPVYLYAYDWERYSSKRSLNLDLERDTPLLFSADPAEIVRAIEADEFDWPAWRAFIDKNVTLPEGTTCCEALMQLLDLD